MPNQKLSCSGLSITRCLILMYLAFSCATLTGCAHHIARSSSSAPLTEIMEPVKDSRQTVQKKPLAFPASVAIVMVPGHKSGNIPNTTLRQAAEKLKQQLLASPRYISTVGVVTTDDLRGRISLEKIQAMYGADIAIILSYQQDQRSSQSGVAGLADATIIGTFLFPGVVTNTLSIIDGKVIHIPSNTIIFRASGTDERSTHSTSYAQDGTTTEESIKGILAATTEFGNSLTRTLSKFENYDFSQAVSASFLTEGGSTKGDHGKPANDYWEKVEKFKSTGGGAFGVAPLLLSLTVCYAAWRRQ